MVRRILRAVAALAALALGGRNAVAQDAPPAPITPPNPRFEASVMAGYRFESGLSSEAGSPFSEIDFGNSPTYGFTLGYNLNPLLELEAQYSFSGPTATAVTRAPGDPNRTFGVGVNDAQIGWIANVGSPGARLRPYFGLAVGVTILHSDTGAVDSVLPSFSVSAGLKWYLSEHAGVRVEFHYIPAYLYTTDGFEFCVDSPYTGTTCWNTGDRYLQQMDVRAGATFRF